MPVRKNNQIDVLEFLKEKNLCAPELDATARKNAHQWAKRNFPNVGFLTPKRGVLLADRGELERAYEAHLAHKQEIQQRQADAARKLSIENSVVRDETERRKADPNNSEPLDNAALRAWLATPAGKAAIAAETTKVDAQKASASPSRKPRGRPAGSKNKT